MILSKINIYSHDRSVDQKTEWFSLFVYQVMRIKVGQCYVFDTMYVPDLPIF